MTASISAWPGRGLPSFGLFRLVPAASALPLPFLILFRPRYGGRPDGRGSGRTGGAMSSCFCGSGLAAVWHAAFSRCLRRLLVRIQRRHVGQEVGGKLLGLSRPGRRSRIGLRGIAPSPCPPRAHQLFSPFDEDRKFLPHEDKGKTRGGGTAPPGPKRAENRVFSAKRQAAWFETQRVSNGKCSIGGTGCAGGAPPGRRAIPDRRRRYDG